MLNSSLTHGIAADRCNLGPSVQPSVQNLSRRLDGVVELLDKNPAAAALGYLRMFIPAKFDLLQRHRKLKSKRLAKVQLRRLDHLFAKEQSLVNRLQEASVVPKVTPPRHSYCKRSWSFALFADCASHLSKVVDAVANNQPLKTHEIRDTMHQAFCENDHTPVIGGFQQNVAWQPRFVSDLNFVRSDLQHTDCLAEQIAIYFACGLSGLSQALLGQFSARAVRTAGDFFEGALLRMLLCDGCRFDGLGLSVVPMDQLLWLLGFLRRSGSEALGVRYREALSEFHQHPRKWHRDEAAYGRTRHCPMALADLCVQKNQLIWGRQTSAPKALGSCHLDFGMSDFTKVHDFSNRSTRDCHWSSRIALLLPLSVSPHRSLTHPTGFFTWFLPALTLFHGEKTRELLSALWSRDGLGKAPERLDPQTTEVFLVPYGDVPETTAAKSPFHLFFQLLSSRVRSLQELRDEECHCFKVALWGFPDPSLRIHGDLDWKDTEYFRTAFRKLMPARSAHFGPSLRQVGVTHVFSTKAAQQAFESQSATAQPKRSTHRVGLLLGYRTAAVVSPNLQRRIENQEGLLQALAELVRRTPPLHLLYLSWEKLTLVDQARLALDYVDILVQPFGAGMSWSLFLPVGSYVVELQQDAIDTAHFVSCFRPSIDGKGWEANNLHSEWGSWAFKNRINFACVSNRPTYAHCKRNFNPTIWDTPSIQVDIDQVLTLVADAARRLANRSSP